MFYSAYAVSFFVVTLHYLVPISNANPSADDKMLIAFMKGNQETQLSEYSMQKYEAHLGTMYYMRNNWQCDKLGKEFEENERTKCQKYRKYLDILYEYLSKEYVGIPAAKPKFAFKKRNEIEIEGPIIYAVNCLTKISQFYFIKWEGQEFKYKLNKLFKYSFEPKLLNEERLNYEVKFENEPKMPINEMILQLAIDTANEYPKDESLNGILRQKLEENLEEIFKKGEERVKYRFPKFDDSRNWINDFLFSEFVKGLAINFTNFSKLTKKYIYKKIKCFTKNGVPINWAQKYETRLGIVYLMRKNWHFDKIGKEFEALDRTECQKYRKYLDIIHEYLFRLYAEAKSPEIKKQLPTLVKPKFLKENSYHIGLISVVKLLNEISEENIKDIWRINLVNEEEIKWEKSEENGEESMIRNEKQKMKLFNDRMQIANLRREFEGKMEKIYEKTKENAKEEKTKSGFPSFYFRNKTKWVKN